MAEKIFSFSCYVCHDLYFGKKPKQFPCFHIFCEKCVNLAARDRTEFPCPYCKVIAKMSELKTSNLINDLEKEILPKDPCEKHVRENYSFYCTTHNLQKLCLTCFEEDHMDCKIYPIKKWEKEKEIIKSYLKKDEDFRKENLKKIANKRTEYIEYVNRRFNDIEREYSTIGKEREEYFEDILNPVEDIVSLEKVREFMEQKPIVEFLNKIKIEYILKKYDSDDYLKCIKQTLDFSGRCNTKEEQDRLIELLKGDDEFKIVVMSQNTELKDVMEDMCTLLQKSSSSSLTDIHLEGCELTEDLCEHLEFLLSECNKLERVNLSNNNEMGAGLMKICDGLAKSSNTLKDIYLGDCNLTEDQSKIFGDFLGKCSTLKRIHLNNNEEMGDGLVKICDELAKSSNTLTDINFGFCDLYDKQLESIEKLLGKCEIEKINLCKNKLSKTIFDKLRKSSSTLKDVQFHGCSLSKDHCKHLGRLLKQCTKIETANFGVNEFLVDICDGLSQSSNTLKHINFTNLKPTEPSQSEYITKLLKKCSRIETIELERNSHMEDELSNIFFALTESANTLKCINLIECKLTCSQSKEFGQMLEKCSKIEEIKLGSNSEMGKGLLKICDGLGNSSNSIKIIDFSYCVRTKEEATNVATMLENCSKLESINITGIIGKALETVCNALVQLSEKSKHSITVICNTANKKQKEIIEKSLGHYTNFITKI